MWLKTLDTAHKRNWTTTATLPDDLITSHAQQQIRGNSSLWLLIAPPGDTYAMRYSIQTLAHSAKIATFEVL